jgi:threonine dehydrogenase-like Zn-dependent dehydrogenase
MKAAVLRRENCLEIVDVPVPALESGFAMIKVTSCGICGSDARYYAGENPWALHTLGYSKPNPPNIILGHEFVGEISAVGNPSDESWIGKRVGVLPYKPCGICHDCKKGFHHLCKNMIHLGHAAGWDTMDYYPGGMAEYCPVWLDYCFEIPENLSDDEAACVDFAGVAYHSVSHAGDLFDKTVLIMGCGPIGNCICQIAKAKGACNVIAIDKNDKALSIIRKLGFTALYNDETFTSRILEMTEGLGVDVVWDTVGTADSIKSSLAVLAKKGLIVNLATHDIEVPINLKDLNSERTLMSTSNYKLKDYPETLSFLSHGLINVEALISSRISLDQVPETLEKLAHQEGHGLFKVIVKPNGEGVKS